jgi:hypothetical protein
MLGMAKQLRAKGMKKAEIIQQLLAEVEKLG